MTGSYAETPVLFGRDRSLVGVGCEPVDGFDAGRPALLFINSGIVHRTGPNRIYVRLARALAKSGYASLRFDLSGIGDSRVPPAADVTRIRERVAGDIDDALERAAEWWKVDSFVMVGLCSGADNALRTMGRRPEVVGAALLDLNVPRNFGFHWRRMAHNLARPSFWGSVLTGRHPIFAELRERFGSDGPSVEGESEEIADLEHDAWLPPDAMEEHLRAIVHRRGKLLCIFTPGLDTYNHREQFLHLFPHLDLRTAVRLEFFADSDHTFSRIHLQDRLVDTIVGWVTSTTFPAPS